ncbi:MAG: response regulator [Proteobacteria bacterium]|nr:response regulator [Pseudomonadota bacterium]MBU0965258.1 response regulator [Pseudomonadota bacterium]
MSESTTRTILFVDDEKSILKALRRIFLDENYHVLTAGSGQEALDLLQTGEKPAVIISDQRMPGMGGAEFLSKAKKILPDTIRMVLTGYADINAAMESINQGGIYRYILKPWNDEELKLSVKDAVLMFDLISQNKRLTMELEKNNLALVELNASLEQKVAERTWALRQIIRELEGRDRIQQYLMEVHPLDELLQTILSVVHEVINISGCAFFLQAEDGRPDPSPAAAINFAERLDTDNHQVLAEAVQQVMTTEEPGNPTIRIGQYSYIAVPVRKGNKKFGALVVKKDGEAPFQENKLRGIISFANQAAIGIHDCNFQENFDNIEASLDDVLAAI